MFSLDLENRLMVVLSVSFRGRLRLKTQISRTDGDVCHVALFLTLFSGLCRDPEGDKQNTLACFGCTFLRSQQKTVPVCVTPVIKHRPCRKTQTSGSDGMSSSSEDSNLMTGVASGRTWPSETGKKQSSINWDSPLSIIFCPASNTWATSDPPVRVLEN